MKDKKWVLSAILLGTLLGMSLTGFGMTHKVYYANQGQTHIHLYRFSIGEVINIVNSWEIAEAKTEQMAKFIEQDKEIGWMYKKLIWLALVSGQWAANLQKAANHYLTSDNFPKRGLVAYATSQGMGFTSTEHQGLFFLSVVSVPVGRTMDKLAEQLLDILFSP